MFERRVVVRAVMERYGNMLDILGKGVLASFLR